MSKTYRPWNPNQNWLLPPSPRDWVPEGDLAYFLLDVVQTLDLSPILGKYELEGRGYPPFHPRMMVTLLLHAYGMGVFSSRRIQKLCERDAAYRVIVGDDVPNFRTISDPRSSCTGGHENKTGSTGRLRRSGNAPGARRMKSPPDAPTTKPATAPPTKVVSERPNFEHKTRETTSAVILRRTRRGRSPSAWPVRPVLARASRWRRKTPDRQPQVYRSARFGHAKWRALRNGVRRRAFPCIRTQPVR